MAYRDIRYGIDGMVTGDEPKFTPEARDLLCSNPKAFNDIYGSHFVKGEVKGASIDMRTEITTESSSSAKSMAVSVRASYESFSFSGEASASMESKMKSSNTKHTAKTYVVIKGGDRGEDIVRNMDMSHATDAVLNFAAKASEGTTLSYQLNSYQTHPDYAATMSCCKVL